MVLVGHHLLHLALGELLRRLDQRIPVAAQGARAPVSAVGQDVLLVGESLGMRLEEEGDLLFGGDGLDASPGRARVLLGGHALEGAHDAQRGVEGFVHRFYQVVVTVLERASPTVLEEHLHAVRLPAQNDGQPPTFALGVAEERAHRGAVVVDVEVDGSEVGTEFGHEVSLSFG